MRPCAAACGFCRGVRRISDINKNRDICEEDALRAAARHAIHELERK